jgi:hypothetical protein
MKCLQINVPWHFTVAGLDWGILWNPRRQFVEPQSPRSRDAGPYVPEDKL